MSTRTTRTTRTDKTVQADADTDGQAPIIRTCPGPAANFLLIDLEIDVRVE